MGKKSGSGSGMNNQDLFFESLLTIFLLIISVVDPDPESDPDPDGSKIFFVKCGSGVGSGINHFGSCQPEV
jgi:hypothetical protein